MKAKKAFYNLTPSRQQEIMDKAMRLYLNNPYEAVTVRLICQELSININTFYRYFPSKDDLYIFLYSQLASRVEVASDYAWSMEDYVLDNQKERNAYTEDELRFLTNWRTLPDEMLQRMIFDPELNPPELTRTSIERGIAEGTMRPDLDVELVTYLYHTASYLLLRYAREHQINDNDTFERMRHYILYDFFNYGLRGQKKAEPECRINEDTT